ncbi:CHASE domain-containing protein [Paraburkholderia denitrificans]|uniref:histidine kinase n=1 Tax=Paraburkholderia denitrificans TaxID=694025 RepID=A0ABW0J5L5_9BURK
MSVYPKFRVDPFDAPTVVAARPRIYTRCIESIDYWGQACAYNGWPSSYDLILMTLFVQYRRLPLKVIAIALVGWLTVAVAIVGVLVASEVSSSRREFSAQSERTYEIIRQRLDQNEAVLAGIESLLHTFPGVESTGLRDYARQMLARYPHIYMIELQPRIEQAYLLGFETWAKQKIYRKYYVKDYGYGGERTWRPVPLRPVYYPITFMEPQEKDALPVLGLDVYADAKFRGALDRTIQTGEPSISAPFDLFEGGRAYLIFKAIYSQPSHEADDSATRAKLSTRIVSMLIHTGKFLDRNELPLPSVSMHIYEQGSADDRADGSIDRIDAKPAPAWAKFLLPEFVFQRDLPSRVQPFVFETRRQLGAEVVPVLPAALTLFATLVITLLALAVYQQRSEVRRAAREAEQRAFQREEQAQAARLSTMGEMASGIAHELNQPLTAILSYNQACIRMLHESAPDYSAVEGAMQAVADQAKRAADIIVRLRAFVSKRPAEVMSLDMRALVRQALALAEPWMNQGEVIVRFAPPDTLPEVQADNIQIEQLVLNLIRNAVEAMGQVPVGQRELTLSLGSDGHNVILSIRDTGSGISPRIRQTLFHPFHTSKADGMGLGLTICQSIAETYGGKVIENASVTSGAEFRLILPVQEKQDVEQR